ncbi:MAG: hypothetical protein FWC48_04660 [Actinomycetia bacterium]|nr:hypothetical protein [Actinomycetes bacterium]
MKYSFTIETDKTEVLEAALRRVKTRHELSDALGAPSRALREYASDVLEKVAESQVELLVDFADAIIDALERPEVFTRANILEILDRMVARHAAIVSKAIAQLEDCLYDEDSKIVRLEAFAVLAHLGATTQARSRTSWEYLSEALRCYHGDPEYPMMLNYLSEMLGSAKVADDVREGVVNLFIFDAEQGKGMVQKRAQQIVELCPGCLKKVKAQRAREAAKREADEIARAQALAEDFDDLD